MNFNKYGMNIFVYPIIVLFLSDFEKQKISMFFQNRHQNFDKYWTRVKKCRNGYTIIFKSFFVLFNINYENNFWQNDEYY